MTERMTEELATTHCQIAKFFGERSCINKFKHTSFFSASRHTQNLEKSKNKKHNVEPYFCAICYNWHVGGVLPDNLVVFYYFLANMVDMGYLKIKDVNIELNSILIDILYEVSVK